MTTRTARHRLATALCAAIGLAGCADMLPQGPEVMRARLSPAVVGQPAAAIAGVTGDSARLITVGMGGEERIEIRQAERNRQTGELMYCTETLTVRAGTVTGYGREGSSC